MKKKAVALAVGALFAAPAVQAQLTMGNETTGTVQVYGKMYPQFGWAGGKGSSQPGTEVSTLTIRSGVLPAAGCSNTTPRYAVDSQNSYIGFRGERNLGGRLKGIWQVEQSIGLDNQTPTANTFSNRNSFAGLSHGALGTIKLGNMDTIYKEYGDTFAMFGIASGNFISASNVLSQSGIGSNNVRGSTSGGRARSSIRRRNSPASRPARSTVQMRTAASRGPDSTGTCGPMA